MIDELKQLWEKKHEPQGRINITVFFVNIFLLLCHIFFMFIYIIIGNKFMIYANIVSLVVYSVSIPFCYKNIDRYMGISFLEIWLHLICGILCFGWTPCYQNWCFGMLTAYFLPAFNQVHTSSRKKLSHFTFLIIFTYFFLATFFPLIDLKITTPLDIYMNSILFIANNSFVFITITLFALFYTSNSNRKELELSRKADYDELTSLYNRYALNQLGNNIINDAKNNNKPYNVAILDIDHFKKINDKYGHTSGDMVLKKISDIMKSYSNNGIISGRWGGEEFVMIAPYYFRYNEFTRKLEQLRKNISKQKFEIENNKKINLTISIGSAKIKEYDDIEKAVSIADVNLYNAKETGRNKLVK